MAIGTPVFVGNGTSPTDVAGNSLAITTTAAVPAGGKILALVSWFHATATVSSTSNGLTWTVDGTGTSSGNASVQLAVVSADAPSGLASGSTVTFNYSANSDARCATVAYCTGLATSSFVDVTAGGPVATAGSSPGTYSSGSASTTNPDDLIFGGATIIFRNTTSTPGTGLTELDEFGIALFTQTLTSMYQVVAATGSYSVNGTFASSQQPQNAVMVAYKAAVTADNTTKPALPGMFTLQLVERMWF